MKDQHLIDLYDALALTPFKSVKTLRRAYEAGELQVFQRAPGARVMIDPDELFRWMRQPRKATATAQIQDSLAKRRAQPVDERSRRTGQPPRRPAEPRSAPPRLTFAELRAA